jgi:hypothetical protein
MGVEKIRNLTDACEADQCFLAVCALFDAADGKRKALKKPFLDGCQYYDGQWREARKPLEALKDHLSKLLSDYEATAREQAVKAAEKQAKRLKDKERAAAMVLHASSQTVDLPCGKWLDSYEFEVTDWRQVPEELLTFDETKAKRLCKNGMTNIPGVKVTLKRKRSARAPSS